MVIKNIYYPTDSRLDGLLVGVNDEVSGMKTDKIKKLSGQLRNVRPKLAEKMVGAGIDSPEKLKPLGAKRAFEKMYSTGDAYGDFNAAYLYALEGAIRDCDWLDIPEKVKREYKEYAQKLQSKKGK